LTGSRAERKFRQQIDALLPRLSRFGLTLTRSRTDADDLIQMACERALSRIDQWDPETRLDSWMFRIMQTIWFNELRLRKVRQHHAEAEMADQEIAESGELSSEMRVMLSRVEEEILWLPDTQRVVLVLVCVEGLTYSEAAKAASIPIGTVMSRLARARLTLMQRLGADKADVPITALFG
jgi:RNA polymerase sigma-70 factor (ECF subfamily)